MAKYQDYLEAITAYEREFKKWEGRVDKILKRYRDDARDRQANAQARFNILWSNVQTLVPATFSRVPQPDVSRRFRDNDPIGRVAALILERALEFEVQHYPDYQTSLRQCVYDRFLGGRGLAWNRYEPHFKPAEQITEDVEVEVNEQLDYECSPVDYVHWKDFGHEVVRTWEECNLVWRIVYMNEDAVKDRFGEEIAKKVPYDASPEDLKNSKRAENVTKKQARIYELWDKSEKKAIWLSKSLQEPLDEREDPLQLQEFFPCPKPLFATITNETLVPVPDFTLYQDQANELDVLSDRIDGLTKMLQLKGVYDASADTAIARLFTEGENGTLLPVKNWAAFAEKQGLKGQIDVYDLTPLVQALKTAQEGMEQVKAQVYEITGISDIIRGQTAASETATAQNIKGQYASLRLRNMQQDVARFATEVLQIKAQIICSKYDPKTIMTIGGVEQLNEADRQFVQQAMALLIGEERMTDPEADSPNPMRMFRIEVAADSLVELDESQEKQDRMEMLQAVGSYLKSAAEAPPQLIPLLVDLGKFGVSAFKVGKTIEGAFDQALDQMKQAAQKAQNNPPPNPEMMKVQAQAQSDQMKVQAQQQADAARLQHDQQAAQMQIQLEQAKMQMEAQARAQEQQAQAAIEQHRNELEAQREMMKQQLEQQMAQQQMSFDQWKAQLDADTKIAVAEIAAKVSMQTAVIGANAKGDGSMEVGEDGKEKKSSLAELLETTNTNMKDLIKGVTDSHEKVISSNKELVKAATAKRRAVRGPDGKITHSEVMH